MCIEKESENRSVKNLWRYKFSCSEYYKCLKRKGTMNRYEKQQQELDYYVADIDAHYRHNNNRWITVDVWISPLIMHGPLYPIFLDIMDFMEIIEFTSVHYFRTVQKNMRQVLRQIKITDSYAEPATNGKSHIWFSQDIKSISYPRPQITNIM